MNPRASDPPRGKRSNRCEYINCALFCLCVTRTPMPLVTAFSGASVSARFSSLAAEKRKPMPSV
jgi:hypothetical protein